MLNYLKLIHSNFSGTKRHSSPFYGQVRGFNWTEKVLIIGGFYVETLWEENTPIFYRPIKGNIIRLCLLLIV